MQKKFGLVQPKHCCGTKKNRLIEHPTHMFKLMGKYIITIFVLLKIPSLDLWCIVLAFFNL